MSNLATLREQVRQRAKCACEFCGVTEMNVGGQLTLDHFQPKSKGGEDTLNNLLYCCVRCNQYKQNYWPQTEEDANLWNPREENATAHFLEGEDGRLIPSTQTGEFTIRRLRLNRGPLVAYRRDRRKRLEESRLLNQYKDLVQVLEQLNQQLSTQVTDQQQLLERQRNLLRFLLRRSQK